MSDRWKAYFERLHDIKEVREMKQSYLGCAGRGRLLGMKGMDMRNLFRNMKRMKAKGIDEISIVSREKNGGHGRRVKKYLIYV